IFLSFRGIFLELSQKSTKILPDLLLLDYFVTQGVMLSSRNRSDSILLSMRKKEFVCEVI
ncbi:MAG: hypothetical protein ACE5NG_03655, partial [bacterium]